MTDLIADKTSSALGLAGWFSTYYVLRRYFHCSPTTSGYVGAGVGITIKVTIYARKILSYHPSPLLGSSHPQRLIAKDYWHIPSTRFQPPAPGTINWSEAVRQVVEAERSILETAGISCSWRANTYVVFGANTMDGQLFDSLHDNDYVFELLRKQFHITWAKTDLLRGGTQEEVVESLRRRLFYDSRYLAADTAHQLIASLLEPEVLTRNQWTLQKGDTENQAKIVNAEGRVVNITRPGVDYSLEFLGPPPLDPSVNQQGIVLDACDCRRAEKLSEEIETIVKHLFKGREPQAESGGSNPT
jgi:hypothetical protein